MLGMSVCYLILGGCFYNIEDIVERKKAESTPVEIKVPPLCHKEPAKGKKCP